MAIISGNFKVTGVIAIVPNLQRIRMRKRRVRQSPATLQKSLYYILGFITQILKLSHFLLFQQESFEAASFWWPNLLPVIWRQKPSVFEHLVDFHIHLLNHQKNISI